MSPHLASSTLYSILFCSVLFYSISFFSVHPSLLSVSIDFSHAFLYCCVIKLFLSFDYYITLIITLTESQTTLKNTEMLNAVGNLTEIRLNITRDLNSSKGKRRRDEEIRSDDGEQRRREEI
jgi:hypothetical protein